MDSRMVLMTVALLMCTIQQCLSQGTEVWNYVTVRPGAHMFYWLYHTYHQDGAMNRPLILWLQGGPGGSSCGYGNFDIIGPVTIGQEPRNTTWVSQANVLFVDQPVGTGYSYVEDPSLYTNTTDELVIDLYTLMQAFYEENPDFRSLPLYIFGQSYGGKMGAAAAQYFHQRIQDGDIEMNLAGFAMGNAWIHPVDSTINWGEFLYWMSNLDEKDQAEVDAVAYACKDAADAGDWHLATDLWRETEYVIWDLTNYVDFYNVLKYVIFENKFDEKRQSMMTERDHRIAKKQAMKKKLREHHIRGTPGTFDELDDIMNGIIREKLEIIPDDVTWGGQADDVFTYQEGDFMKPVVDIVGDMLENTDLDVIVYQGQLDLICLTKGALDWVQKLEPYWSDYQNFNNAERSWLVAPENGQTDTFIKAYNNFKFYWNLRAGHAVPKDDGWGAYRMLERILADEDN